MKYELGNLMGENLDASALDLLGYRLMAMQKEREEMINRNVAARVELKGLYRYISDLEIKLEQYENNNRTDR